MPPKALCSVASWSLAGRSLPVAWHSMAGPTSPPIQVPPNMNDRNLREPSRYHSEDECLRLTSLSPDSRTVDRCMMDLRWLSYRPNTAGSSRGILETSSVALLFSQKHRACLEASEGATRSVIMGRDALRSFSRFRPLSVTMESLLCSLPA